MIQKQIQRSRLGSALSTIFLAIPEIAKAIGPGAPYDTPLECDPLPRETASFIETACGNGSGVLVQGSEPGSAIMVFKDCILKTQRGGRTIVVKTSSRSSGDGSVALDEVIGLTSGKGRLPN